MSKLTGAQIMALSVYPPLFFKNRKSTQASASQPQTQRLRSHSRSESRCRTWQAGCVSVLFQMPRFLLLPSSSASESDSSFLGETWRKRQWWEAETLPRV